METPFGFWKLTVGDRSQILSAKLKANPLLFRLIAATRETNKKRLIRRNTDIVIEGPSRSANHFSTYAFMQAQKKPVKVAHNFHASAQLILAARWGIPAICLIREPHSCAMSDAVYKHWVSPEAILNSYWVFYESLIPYKDHLVVADIREVTTDMGLTIRRVNAKFGTNFDEFVHSGENLAVVTAAIRAEHETHMQSKVERDPLPNKWKETRKQEIRKQLERHTDLLADCRALYDTVTSVSA